MSPWSPWSSRVTCRSLRARAFSQQLAHRVHQTLLGQRLHEEGIGAGFTGTAVRGEDAEDQHDRVLQLCLLAYSAAERQPIQLWHEDLGDDDVRLHLSRHRESRLAIGGKLHAEPGFIQKKGFEITHVRI